MVRDVLKTPPRPPVSYREAQRSMNLLMTVTLVSGAGRPSHVTGITVKHLLEARVSASPMMLLVNLYD